MALKDIWKDLVDGVSEIDVDDINNIAGAVIDIENEGVSTDLSNYYTKQEVENISSGKADISFVEDKIAEIINNSENISNKVTSVSEEATNEQYPSAKAVKEYVDNSEKEAVALLKKKSIPYTTATGCTISISDHLEGESVIDYKVYGNSVQDGTPTPETPIEIQSVGDLVTDEASEYYGKYDIPITVTGKNLIKYPYYHTTRTVNGVTWTDNGDGTITASGTPTGNTSFSLANRMSISTNTKYCFSGIDGTSNIMLNVTLFDENNTFVADLSNTNTSNSLAFDTTDYPSAIYARILIKRKENGVEVSGTIKPQLELGTTATEYEPYKGSETIHIYLDEPLRKVGASADYIDYRNQKVIRQVEVLDDTGAKTIDESLGLLDTPTEEIITIPELTTPISSVANVSIHTTIKPSNMELTYYQDINKVITNLTNAILAQGGNV